MTAQDIAADNIRLRGHLATVIDERDSARRRKRELGAELNTVTEERDDARDLLDGARGRIGELEAQLNLMTQLRDSAVDDRRWYEDAARRAVTAWRVYDGDGRGALDLILAQLAHDLVHVGGAHDELAELLGASRRVLDGHLHRAVIRQSDLDNLNRLDEIVARLVPTSGKAAAAVLRDGRYCPDHDVDLVPPDRTLRTRRYCPKCPDGSALGFPLDEEACHD